MVHTGSEGPDRESPGGAPDVDPVARQGPGEC